MHIIWRATSRIGKHHTQKFCIRTFIQKFRNSAERNLKFVGIHLGNDIVRTSNCRRTFFDNFSFSLGLLFFSPIIRHFPYFSTTTNSLHKWVVFLICFKKSLNEFLFWWMLFDFIFSRNSFLITIAVCHTRIDTNRDGYFFKPMIFCSLQILQKTIWIKCSGHIVNQHQSC